MRNRILYTVFLIFFISVISIAQERKSLETLRIETSPTIDGVLDETEWNLVALAENFTQSNRYIGEKATYPTYVKVLYNDKAIYIGAFMKIDCAENINRQLTTRDDMGQTDYFGVTLDPFNDYQNGYCFYVTSRNVQLDYKIDAQDYKNGDWDAVWYSDANIVDSGWLAEIMIPYSALRFSGKDVQDWGINFERSYNVLREYSTWNLVDTEKGSALSQTGLLSPLKKIKPPFRLSATPYLMASLDHNTVSKKWQPLYNYGLDLKAGLSKSSTLDLTLIPDFGQVESDDKIYSLEPFEVYYDEKRPFFTEGTELFSRGDVFYSRRIGHSPKDYDKINSEYSSDDIIENPESMQLINAMKISGKNSKGTSIGFFNAMTSNTYAIVRDSNHNEHKVMTSPFTNYNMIVVDQALYQSSYISFYNTNVITPKDKYSANVTGTQFRLRDKNDCYGIYAVLALSQHYTENKPVFGNDVQLSVEKAKGRFRADVWLRMISDKYNINDLGYLERNNQISNGVNLNYFVFQPVGKIVEWTTKFYAKQFYLNIPRKFEQIVLGFETYGNFKNYYFADFEAQYVPLGQNDYFEPRVSGRFFHREPVFWFNYMGSPDYRKKFIVDHHFGIKTSTKIKQFNWWATLTPRWRVSNNLLLLPSFYYDLDMNAQGYVTHFENNGATEIVFGRRDVKNMTATIEAEYSFTNKSSLSFKLRHYWLIVDYLSYYDLQQDGKLKEKKYTGNADFSVNAFNIDLVFKWNFAQGSELLLIWKNSIYSENSDEKLVQNYFDNVERMFDSPVSNSLSIKALYYIDWQYLKKI